MHRSLIQPAVHMEAGPREGCSDPVGLYRSARDHVRRQFLGRPREDSCVPVTIQAIGVFSSQQQRGTQCQKECNYSDKTCNAGPSPEQGEHDRSLPFPLKNLRRVQCRFPDMRPIPIIVDCIHNSSTLNNQDEFSFPGRGPAPSVENFCRKNLRCTSAKGCPGLAGKEPLGENLCRIRRRSPSIPPPGEFKGGSSRPCNGGCFIRAETTPPGGVRKFFVFSRLFLDSPTRTPYLVCVLIIDHKIHYR